MSRRPVMFRHAVLSLVALVLVACGGEYGSSAAAGSSATASRTIATGSQAAAAGSTASVATVGGSASQLGGTAASGTGAATAGGSSAAGSDGSSASGSGGSAASGSSSSSAVGSGSSASGSGSSSASGSGGSAASGSGGSAAPTAPATPPQIVAIALAGAPVKVFDHTTDQQEPDNIPDAQVSAWREANGTVDLMIPSSEAYRMRGADLLHLAIDTHKIYSSANSGSKIDEASHDYHHWLMGPYGNDGVHFYSISHSEWYACLLDGDCNTTGSNGMLAQFNSWANTLNQFVSTDGGADWQLNGGGGNHVIADASYHWTGTPAQVQEVYLQALDHTGIFQPSRLVQEGAWWYCVAGYIHRDFSGINPATGVYQAPIDQYGYILLRTSDYTNPNGWQAWTGGGNWSDVANRQFQTFEPHQGSVVLDGTPPQLLYDSKAKVFVLFHTLFGGQNAMYYMTTSSMANPNWSDSVQIAGTAGLVTDPAGGVQGFNDENYASVLDPASPGYNFEFINGSPWLFYSTFPAAYGGDNTARDLYRVPLAISYQ